MKISDAILIGCKMKPKKVSGSFYNKNGTGSCVLGALIDGLKKNGIKDYEYRVCRAEGAFYKHYGAHASELNDESDTSREEIAGMFQAIGK